MKPPKEQCEICGLKDKAALDWHHIIPRTDEKCTNDSFNLAVLCSSCHRLSHSGDIEIIGVYPSTHKYGRILVFKRNGIPNIPDIEDSCYKGKI